MTATGEQPAIQPVATVAAGIPLVTVAISTRNRGDLIAETLEAFWLAQAASTNPRPVIKIRVRISPTHAIRMPRTLHGCKTFGTPIAAS